MEKPPKTKYEYTWDPKQVLNYLEQLFPHDELTLEQLSQKTVTLLALVTAHRVQTLDAIKISNFIFQDDRILIKITDKIKTSGVNRPQPLLNLPYFRDNNSLMCCDNGKGLYR